MLYKFPPDAVAVVIRDYRRPYDDPISVRRGEAVTPDRARTEATDFIGWTWCVAADGREGWVPESWLDRKGGACKLRRDFSALELTVASGERVTLEYSESGFVFCRRSDGARGWLPDAILKLASDRGNS